MIRLIGFLFLLPLFAYSAINDVDKQMIFPKNIMLNGGFENGKGAGVDKWTASGGTFTTVTSGSNLLTGKVSATWNSNGSSQTLSYGGVTIPKGLYGKSGVFAVKTQVPSGTATHLVQVTDGTNILASQTITSSATPVYNFVNFIFPSTGTVVGRIISVASDEPLIAIDDAFIGDALEINLTNISQASFVGGIEQAGASNCSFTESSSSGINNFVALGSAGSCASAWTTTGSITAVGATSHEAVYSNMPPGSYLIVLNANFTAGGGNTCNWRLSDGTNTFQTQTTSSTNRYNTLSFHATYTGTANRTFTIQAADDGTSCILLNDTAGYNASWKFYRFPSTSEIAYRPSAVPFFWEGRHDGTCAWTRNNASYGDPAGDSTCTLADYLNINAGTVTSTSNGALTLTPGISLVFPRTSRYEICSEFRSGGDTTGATNAFQLVCGAVTIAQKSNNEPASGGLPTDVCGIYSPSAVSSSPTDCKIQMAASSGTGAIQANSTYHYTVRWTVKDLLAPLSAPYISNSVVSPSSGVEQIMRASITGGNPPSIASQSGTWLTYSSRSGAGDYSWTIAAGTFSGTPTCVCTHGTDTSNFLSICNIYSVSSTALRTQIYNTSSGVDHNFQLVCMGPK